MRTDWLLNDDDILDGGSDWFRGIKAKTQHSKITLNMDYKHTTLTRCFKNSHQSFEAFQFKYTKRVYEKRENVYQNFLLSRRISIDMTNPCLNLISRNNSNISRSFRFLPLLPKYIVIYSYSKGGARDAKKGEKRKYVCVHRLLGLTLSNLLSVILTEFCSRFSKICIQTSCLFSCCMIIVRNANNRAFSEETTCRLISPGELT